MASIKQIEKRTVHRIQSGQVIVDIGSVVKELVENSLDAGASSIDIRFRNQGLDAIEVQDNGNGIRSEDYDSVALKHYTSKLESYADIAALDTFGFRGEALSSICALAQLTISTCRAADVPKGSKLEFEPSGKLKSVTVTAAKQGTTVVVEKLFHNLPVRRRELERNIKREWTKIITLLNQYACIQTGVRFTASQQPIKGKRIILFSTSGNRAVRDNVLNIYGAKTMTSLMPVDVELDLVPTTSVAGVVGRPATTTTTTTTTTTSKSVRVTGLVSRPAHGEGRQTPDRQMFYVNSRPCTLPQFAKVFTEVYRAYNANQAPFILANIQLDTNLYDVNVSPDKRTILLHDQGAMLDALREKLVALFDGHGYAVQVNASLASDVASQPLLAPPSERMVSPSSADIVNSVPQRGELLSHRDQGCETEPLVRRRLTHHDDDNDDHDDTGGTENDIGLSNDNVRQARQVSSDNLSGMEVNQPVKDSRREENSGPAPATSILGAKLAAFSASASASRFANVDQSSSIPRFSSRASATYQPASQNTSQIASASGISTAFDLMMQQRSRATFLSGQQPFRSTTGSGTAPRITSSMSTRRTLSNTSHGPSSGPFVDEDDDPDSANATYPHKRFKKVSAENSTGHRSTSDRSLAENVSPQFLGSSEAPLSTDGHGTSDAMELDDDDDASRFSRTERIGTTALLSEGLPLSSMAPLARGSSADSALETHRESSVLSKGQSRQGTPAGRSKGKYSTRGLSQNIVTSETAICDYFSAWRRAVGATDGSRAQSQLAIGGGAGNRIGPGLDVSDGAEDRLTLIISKADFGRMRVVGQFNLGFILAVKPASSSADGETTSANDDLFIIDQHASDEKFNFERLQAQTTLQSQRLVRSKQLDLTAVEEEIVINNLDAIEANGFKIAVDDPLSSSAAEIGPEDTDMDGSNGNGPVGRVAGSRCRLSALPLSRDTTFTIEDLDELIHLLGEHQSLGGPVPRPSKVRKMFAMRACRSSIMIGKALTHGQMVRVVRHMGELDKPWNCPHGRPTMRHLAAMRVWDSLCWKEDDAGVVGAICHVTHNPQNINTVGTL